MTRAVETVSDNAVRFFSDLESHVAEGAMRPIDTRMDTQFEPLRCLLCQQATATTPDLLG